MRNIHVYFIMSFCRTQCTHLSRKGLEYAGIQAIAQICHNVDRQNAFLCNDSKGLPIRKREGIVRQMKKRIFASCLALLLTLAVLPIGTSALDLPNGWWPVWSAYTAAADNTQKLLEISQYLTNNGVDRQMRIGAEMDVWADAVTSADFVVAYRYVADMVRTLAPKGRTDLVGKLLFWLGCERREFLPKRRVCGLGCHLALLQL